MQEIKWATNQKQL